MQDPVDGGKPRDLLIPVGIPAAELIAREPILKSGADVRMNRVGDLAPQVTDGLCGSFGNGPGLHARQEPARETG